MGTFVKYAVLLPLLMLAGCGSGSATPSASGTADSAAGAPAPWVVVKPGKPTPSPGVAVFTGTPPPGLPSVSYLPTSPAGCTMGFPEADAVLIPMEVTIGTGSFTVQWPNRYGNTYRLTAVPQDIVTGAQPEPIWQTVSTGAECTASATISGLVSGRAYIIWLDAPDTPRRLDGSRSLYSGKTGVLIPN